MGSGVRYPTDIDKGLTSAHMDLVRHLRLFVAVAEHRHFGRAAASLSMAQPPLSQGVQRLERHLGQRLFDRDARRVALTAPGSALLPAARQLLADADALVESSRRWSERHCVRLGLAADLDALAGPVLAHLVGTGIDVEPVLAGSTELVGRLRDGDLDVVLVRHPVALDGLLTGDVITVSAAVVPDHDDLPLVLPPRSHHPAAHDQVVDALLRLGRLAPVHEIASAHERSVRVEAGLACGLRPTLPTQEGDVQDGSADLVPLRYRAAVPVISEQRPDLDHAAVVSALHEALR